MPYPKSPSLIRTVYGNPDPDWAQGVQIFQVWSGLGIWPQKMSIFRIFPPCSRHPQLRVSLLEGTGLYLLVNFIHIISCRRLRARIERFERVYECGRIILNSSEQVHVGRGYLQANVYYLRYTNQWWLGGQVRFRLYIFSLEYSSVEPQMLSRGGCHHCIWEQGGHRVVCWDIFSLFLSMTFIEGWRLVRNLVDGVYRSRNLMEGES